MKHLLLFPVFAFMLLCPYRLSAQSAIDNFFEKMNGKWYLTEIAGGYTGDIDYNNPLPADSMILSRIPGTDSVQMAFYPYNHYEHYGVAWSNYFNSYTFTKSGNEYQTVLRTDLFQITSGDIIKTYKHFIFTGLEFYNGRIDSVADLMKGRWYLNARGPERYVFYQYPGSGDSVIVSVDQTHDSVFFSNYMDCRLQSEYKYRFGMDSSYSWKTKALMLIDETNNDRKMVSVEDGKITLKADVITGDYFKFIKTNSTTFYPAPVLLSVTSDTACNPEDLALLATSSPGEIGWYTAPEGGDPIAYGSVFFPHTITETTTFYAEASLNGCKTPRIPVLAFVDCLVSNAKRTDDDHITVFPDPTSGKFRVVFNPDLHYRYVRIFNTSGMKLKEYLLIEGESSLNMDISEYPKGLYYILIQDDWRAIVKKVLKQ